MRVVVSAAIVLGLLSALFVFVYRPWSLTWGATPEEVGREMIGDAVVELPTFNATRAVTIGARPEEVWPWIVQMGYKQGGFYSWDFLDNDRTPSANRLLPPYQDRRVGDSIPLSASEYARVTALDRNRLMLLEHGGGAGTTFTWAWELNATEGGSTRLVTRLRWRANVLTTTLLELAEIVMMRKCLLGIKQRAEAART